MRIYRRILLASTLAASLFAGATVHASQLEQIKKKGELVVGILGTDEPNSFIDPKTREYIGYEVDLAKEVAAKMGVKPVFKQVAVAVSLNCSKAALICWQRRLRTIKSAKRKLTLALRICSQALK